MRIDINKLAAAMSCVMKKGTSKASENFFREAWNAIPPMVRVVRAAERASRSDGISSNAKAELDAALKAFREETPDGR